MYTIMVVKDVDSYPQRIKDMLKDLSTVLWIEEKVKSAAHSGTGMVLAQAKAFLTGMDPCEMVGGFPQRKIDASQDDFARCVKDTQVAVTQMVDELDLAKYQLGHDEGNKRIMSWVLV